MLISYKLMVRNCKLLVRAPPTLAEGQSVPIRTPAASEFAFATVCRIECQQYVSVGRLLADSLPWSCLVLLFVTLVALSILLVTRRFQRDKVSFPVGECILLRFARLFVHASLRIHIGISYVNRSCETVRTWEGALLESMLAKVVRTLVRLQPSHRTGLVFDPERPNTLRIKHASVPKKESKSDGLLVYLLVQVPD